MSLSVITPSESIFVRYKYIHVYVVQYHFMLSITILIFNVNRTIDKNYVSNKELFFEKYEVIKYGRVLSSLITPYNTQS